MSDERTKAGGERRNPEPNPALKRLDVLIGRWSVTNRDLNTGEEWRGEDVFKWLDGGFFLAYYHEEFREPRIKGIMLIGYERKWAAEEPSRDLVGHWFESTTGNHFEYVW
jgi:hypothetical protein